MTAPRKLVYLLPFLILGLAAFLIFSRRQGAPIDPPTYKGVKFNENKGILFELIVSPDGRRLVCYNHREEFGYSFWDLEELKELRSKVLKEEWFLAFLQEDSLLAFSSNDKSIHLQTLPDFKEVSTLEGHRVSPFYLGVPPGGKTLVSASPKEIIVWDPRTKKPQRTVSIDINYLTHQALLQKGKMLVMAGHLIGEVGLVSCWDLDEGKEVWSFRTHKSPSDSDHYVLRALAGSPDDITFATAGIDGYIRVWDSVHRKQVLTIPSFEPGWGEVHELAFSEDGKVLAGSIGGSPTEPGLVVFWDAATGKKRAVRKTQATAAAILLFRPGGKHLLVGMSGFEGRPKTFNCLAELWDLKSILTTGSTE